MYGEYVGLFSLMDAQIFEGDMPGRIQQMIKTFIEYYRERLMEMWEKQQFELLPPIE